MKTLLLLLCLIGVAYGQTSALIILGVQPSVSSCKWPSFATVSNGTALCPVNVNGVVFLATALNGGAFTIPSSGGGGTQGPQGIQGIPGPQGPAGSTLKSGTVLTVNETCPKGSGNITNGWSTKTCIVTVQ